MDEETTERTFNTGENPRLSLGNIRGSVEIAPGEEGIIQVTAVKHLNSGDAQNTEILMTQAGDGSVSVETHYLEFGLGLLFLRRPCKVDYTVRVPRRCALKISGVSNPATVQEIEGDISIHSVSGPLTLKGLAGNLNISTVSGTTSGEGLSGQLRLKAVSGAVTLTASHLTKIEGSTVSGSLDIQTGLSEGPYRFHSVSGNMRLHLPAETGCQVHVRSISGRLRSDVPSSFARQRGGRQDAQVLGGGPEVFFDSTSGDFWLVAPEGAQPVAEALATPERASEETIRRVLEQIAKGELSAEEGLRAIS